MIKTRPLEGVIPVLQTPLTADGAIDHEAIARHIDFLIGKEVGGFWALGTGSEDMNLTFAKRLAVAESVTNANDGRVPLILGAGFYCMEDSIEFMRQTEGLEFDAYHVMPYHPLLSKDRLEWYYRTLADTASRPLWMYTSANWAQPIPPDFIARLKSHPNIAGIKFSTQRTTDMLKVVSLVEDGFQMITAVAAQWAVCLCMGVRAGTTSLAGVLPEPLTEIYRLMQAGERETAMAAQQRLNAFLGALPKKIKADNFLGGAEEKYILKLRGICEPYMTDYYRELDGEEQAEVDQALKRFSMLPYEPTPHVPPRQASG